MGEVVDLNFIFSLGKILGCFCLQSLSKLCGPDGRKRGGETTGVGRQKWGDRGGEAEAGSQTGFGFTAFFSSCVT